MKRIVVLARVGFLLLTIALFGCAEPPRGVVVWHSYRGDEQRALEVVAARFEEETGIHVSLLATPYESYLSKLEAAIPRGNGPDIFLGPHNRLGEYLANDLVADAGDAFPLEDIARYDPVTVAAVTVNDKRYAVPLASKCLGLYIDTDLLKSVPTTLEELAAAKRELPASVFPLAYEAHVMYHHAPLLHAYGGRLTDGEHFTMVGKEAERAAAKARELTANGIVPEEPSGDLVKQLFLSKRAATVISGPWLAGDIGRDVHYRVVPLPRVSGEGPMRPYLTVDGAFLTPGGARSEKARAFARALGDVAAARDRAVIGKEIVATKKFWDDEGDRADSLLRAFREASKDAVVMPSTRAMQSMWVPADQALRKVLRGNAEPRVALDEAKADFEDVMRAPPAAKSPIGTIVLSGGALLALALFAVRRARTPSFSRELRGSVRAYKYVAHAALVILVLVVLPLVAGAATSLFAGSRDTARFVDLGNYVQILTVRGKPVAEYLSSGSFYLTLLVTILWTVLNVGLHVGIGLVLGILLARPYLRLRSVYRVLLILPWAVPSYVTALAWKGMFHRQFGAINAVLSALGAEPVSWFSKFSTAFTANLATNVWLGFPFMMVVVLGALTSISKDVLEAAEVDGATRFQSFRLVTLPLLKPVLLPAVVLGSVWTFNMFNVIFLVSGGEPNGATDILVSEAYRWAFTRNSQFGYAAAYAVIIFGLLALMSRVMQRIGREEENRA